MSPPAFRFEGEVREWAGPTSWHFVLLPNDIADEIADHVEGLPRTAFGAVRVEAEIGGTRWRTSLFPSKAEATYMLSVKKAVRAAEALVDGTPVTVGLRVLD